MQFWQIPNSPPADKPKLAGKPQWMHPQSYCVGCRVLGCCRIYNSIAAYSRSLRASRLSFSDKVTSKRLGKSQPARRNCGIVEPDRAAATALNVNEATAKTNF